GTTATAARRTRDDGSRPARGGQASAGLGGAGGERLFALTTPGRVPHDSKCRPARGRGRLAGEGIRLAPPGCESPGRNPPVIPPNALSLWFTIEQVGDVTVVRFARASILEDEAVAVVRERLFDLVDNQGRRLFVLNFRMVTGLASRMLGQL